MLYAGYNPIDSNHPRYLKHKLTMNDTDRLVESGTKCAMLPVDNHLLTSQDATTTYVHLNAQPSKTDVGQRKANLAQPGSAGHRRGASGALSRRNGAAICDRRRPQQQVTGHHSALATGTTQAPSYRSAEQRAFNGNGIKVKSMLISNPAGHMGPFWECVTVTGT
jgi:hypothetical protein